MVPTHPGSQQPLSPCTPSAAECVFIAASSLRMIARHSWHRDSRSLWEPVSLYPRAGRRAPGEPCPAPTPLTSDPGTGRAHGPAAPALLSHLDLSSPELGTQHISSRQPHQDPTLGWFPTVARVGVRVDEARVEDLLSKSLDHLFCYLGEGWDMQ